MSVQPPLIAGKTKSSPQRRTRPVGPPPLTAGDRLTRAEFEQAMTANPFPEAQSDPQSLHLGEVPMFGDRSRLTV